jgi:hypothetical protein
MDSNCICVAMGRDLKPDLEKLIRAGLYRLTVRTFRRIDHSLA